MKSFLLGFLLLSPALANAGFNFNLFSGDSAGCEPGVGVTFPSNAQAVAAYKRAIRAQRFCEAADAADYLAYADEEKGMAWAARAIESYTAQGDYRQASVYGLRALDGFSEEQSPEALEPVRFALVQAVFSTHQKLGQERDPTWREWAIGVRRMVTPSQRNLSLYAFLEDYPDSKHAVKVRVQADSVAAVFIDQDLAVVESLLKKKQLFAAITRMESLYHAEKYSGLYAHKDFGRILEKLVSLQDRLITEIPRMPEKKLQDMAHVPYSEKVDRQAMQKSTAERMCNLLKSGSEVFTSWKPSANALKIRAKRCR